MKPIWKWLRPVPSVSSVTISLLALAEPHPNRLPFEGCLTMLDTVSDRSPSGARGHRVVLTRATAETALHSLMGMAVNYKAGWDGHDQRRKCGIITSADISGKRLMVKGFLFARDFPDFVLLREQDLGMSYEIADARVADMRAPIWELNKVTFTGAAILQRAEGAYSETWFKAAAKI